ncbi:MAG: TonB-dependent receptor plug domain-containing protein, partial [Microbacterium sp.]|nr:TonB-dependent receptor plug domain-containing protein [Microbacterium sp.]
MKWLGDAVRQGSVVLLGAIAVFPDSAAAQVQLPGIVVTTPSPIQRPRPAPAPRPATATAPTVSAAPAAPPPGTLVVDEDAFVPITVMNTPEITPLAVQNIGDVTAQQPGVAATTFAPGASRPIIRGQDRDRVRVQENGIGSHDVSALSEDHAVPIDPFAAERIEI